MTDDEARELIGVVGTLVDRVTALEAQPPAGSWARSTAWLIERFVTTRNVAKVAAGLATIYMAVWSAVNGVPGV